MKLSGNEDLRVRRTIKSIHRAFTEMLLEMPYEKVTVTELSKRAEINKKTFYRYYPTLDDLLQEVQMEYAQPFAEMTAGLRYPDDADAITREFLLYSAKQGPLYDVIISSGAYSSILDKLIDEMGKERTRNAKAPEGWTDKEWSLYISLVSNAQVHFYKKWVEDGREVPVNRMAALGVKTICYGANL